MLAQAAARCNRYPSEKSCDRLLKVSMKLRQRKNWLCVLIALSWLLVCNVAVAETAFVMLHDLADSHGHSHDKAPQNDHEHHTTHHPGHNQEHKHGEDSDSHSHGESTPTSFTSPRQLVSVSLIDSPTFQPLSLGWVSVSEFLSIWEPVRLKSAIGPPGASISSRLLSSLSISSNAPPASLLA